MTEENEKNEGGTTQNNHNEFFSKPVRAGKRTYFFDVKATRGNDFYLTITESKKRFGPDGKFFYEKHKIFLYKEDFEKFTDGLTESVAYIKANSPEVSEHTHESHHEHGTESANNSSQTQSHS
ncbi:MAG: PUR family DNA/RNA-binding protein, partial [Bacteroidia bacterium]|nr:PUR family DNA/RNA-binding protein [Bacteroidia bacterium]